MNEQTILDKEGMLIYVPNEFLIRVNRTSEYDHYFFVGFIPAKEFLANREFALGVVDFSLAMRQFIPSSIRCVRVKSKNDTATIRLIDEAVHYVAFKLGVVL